MRLLSVTSTAAVLVLAASAASSQSMPPISEVSVTSDIEAVDSNALDLWPTIDADLNEAILAAVGPALASEGYQISVTLNEVSLGGVAALPETGEFNRLGGWLYVRANPEDPPVLQEEIVLDATTFVPGTMGEIFIIPGRPEFYNALVNVFAYRVLEEVEALD